ncbi:glycosyl hydrolase family 39 domain protein [Rhizoctonia solani AG-3 Rhs1AP]|uniref:Glycosyl hydrolase family 39 domain protein n=1 Tax=Rhizoctonia solani AG-3 Rhs1AP TaxID=1086054 RepID=X8IZU8_9AGAM|nr:glycosyl hydrolase family 39 domain protein [Rhizoctonia solani AG-3 Rhs1AP]
MNETGLPAGNRWAVVLSARAVKELRKLERDQKALEIVHKKIRDLSSGNFSDENHRPIIGTLQHVPLFRARAPLDLRIIYQIDVLPDSGGNYDHQVIKIFQIESRARVDYGFWAKVSVRLQRTNPKYRSRSQYRRVLKNATQNGGDHRQYPAMFPHEDYGFTISNEESGFLLDGLTDEEQEQIQEITMDRFAPFNKALYNSVVADLEMVLPMVLDEHEREIVSHKGASIVIGRSGTGKTTALIYKIRAVDQEHAAKEEREPIRQMFVTRSRVLAQHVEATYQGLAEFTNIALKSDEQLKEIAKQSRENPDRALVEFDTEVDLRGDLPPRFSQLTHSHFPLFVSFDKLCSLLEGDIREAAPGQISSERTRSLIGYDDFLHSYWPSFRGSTHGLEPNLVWSEIIGVIKGSQAAFNSNEGYLSRSEYVEGLSQRQFSLLAPLRAKVYSIFELYTRRRTAQYDTDEADRTRVILHNLPKILERPNIDYLYVDEVQDNLMIDIYLLRKLAKSIENIYWSGDSAQTVVAGSSFRINDLKAFTYQDQAAVSGRKATSAPQFTTFDLNVNFRSLSGIVRFARFLVQAIHKLFPQTIDLMEPERAKQFGDPPILFTNIKNEAGYFEKFLLGSSASNRVVFGAQQAILVRDAAAAEELDSRLQGLCNVLPIMDSKGLEFDDVLVYNFFSQSPAPIAAWEYLSGNTRWNQPPPPVLCSELKLLYVAVTRARRRCWIWDSGPLVDQLQTMWMGQKLVRTEPASRMVGQLAASSSKAQWSAKGREYFSHRLYKLAAACFRQAEQMNDAKLSTAYHLMSRAKLRRLRGDTPASREELAAAATELVSCAELPGIGDPKPIYFHAATCFQSAERLLPAASAFVKAGRANDGIHMLFEAHDYKSATSLLVDNREAIEADVFEQLRQQTRVYLFDHREYKHIGLVFDTVDEQVTYARQPQYKTQLKQILANHRRYHELAEEYLIEKNLADAVKYFLKAYQTHQTHPSILRAVDLTIGHTESVLLVEGTYRKNDQDLAKALVEKVQPFASCAQRDDCLKVDMFHSYLSADYISIEMIRAWDQGTLTHQCMRALASYLAIKSNSWLTAASLEILLEYLDMMESYKADITRLIKENRACASLFAQRLLGFAPIESPEPSEVKFRALKNSLITHRVPKAAFLISGDEIDEILRDELPKRLQNILTSFHTGLLNSSHIQSEFLSSTTHAHPPFRSPTEISNKSCVDKLHVFDKILGVLDVKMLGVPGQWCDHTIDGHQWLERLFETSHYTTGELVRLGPVPPEFALNAIPGWLTRDWTQIRNSPGISGNSVTHLLLHCLVRSGLQGELSEHTVAWPTPTGAVSSSDFKTCLVTPLQEMHWGHNYGRINAAVDVVRFILGRNDRPDATVMIHFIEALVRDILVHMNPARQPDFDGLLLPLSWAQNLARRYKDVYEGCSIERFSDLCVAIQQVSRELRFEASERWLVNRERIKPGLVDLLNLRLCWCVSLVIGHMGSFDQDLPLVLETLQKMSCDEMPPNSLRRNSTAFGAYHAFAEADDRHTTLTVLSQTFRHEVLILMQQDSYCHHPAKYITGVQMVPCTNPAEFLAKLSQATSVPTISALFEDSSGARCAYQASEPGNDYSDGEPRFTACYTPEYQSSSEDAGEGPEYWH